MVDPAALVSRRNSHPMTLAAVRSCDDVPDYRSRWRADEQADVSFQHYVHPKFRHDRRSHPVAGPVPTHPWPQRRLGADSRISQPSPTDWKGYPRGRPPFEDFAVGFENEATSSVPDDLGEDVQGRVGFMDDEEDTAFDEITQQIASLTQTVNELRFKHRRPVVATQGQGVFRGGGNRKHR